MEKCGLTLRQANLLYVESCARSRAYMVISTIFKLSWYTVKLTIKAQYGEKEILWCPTNFPYDVTKFPMYVTFMTDIKLSRVWT